MTKLIDPTTLQITGTETRWAGTPNETTYEVGTVEVTLRRETRRVPCRRSGTTIYAQGLTGRYETGKKAWPAHVTLDAEGREFVFFGRDDRSGRFNKVNCLYFGEAA